MDVWVSCLMSGVDVGVGTRQSRSSSAVPVCFTQSKHLEVVAMPFPTHLCRFSCLLYGSEVPGPYSGLAFGCQKSCLRTDFQKAFASSHRRLYWRGVFWSQVVFWNCCCGFCNRSVFFRDWVVSQRPTLKPGGPVDLLSEVSFSYMDCRQRVTSSVHLWFRIRVFLLLGGLPTKAIELYLPGFWNQLSFS